MFPNGEINRPNNKMAANSFFIRSPSSFAFFPVYFGCRIGAFKMRACLNGYAIMGDRKAGFPSKNIKFFIKW